MMLEAELKSCTILHFDSVNIQRKGVKIIISVFYLTFTKLVD